MHRHCMWDTGHLEDLPHHQSCLQRTKHPETALSAEVSVWQGLSVAERGQGRCRRSTGPGAPEAAPRPGFSTVPEAGRCSGGRRVESCWRGDLGVSKGQFQKLTARAKTPVLSPSEVHVLCSGQFPSTSRTLSCASSAVLGEHKMVFHRVMAALWGQSSVSGQSQTQNRGLGRSGVLSWLLPLPLPTAHHQQYSGSPALWGQAPEEEGGSIAAGSGADMPGLGKGAARGPWNSLLLRHLEQAVQGDGLVGPIPVTRWGHTQESHHHISGLCLSEIQQGPVQPVLSKLI